MKIDISCCIDLCEAKNFVEPKCDCFDEPLAGLFLPIGRDLVETELAMADNKLEDLRADAEAKLRGETYRPGLWRAEEPEARRIGLEPVLVDPRVVTVRYSGEEYELARLPGGRVLGCVSRRERRAVESISALLPFPPLTSPLTLSL